MNLDSNQVAEYLKKNPEFFERNITLLTDVELPHPHNGSAISISERQVMALREKNRMLETKLTELIQFGEENDAISEKIHRLSCALIGCRNINQVLTTVSTHMQETFSVPHALVRLWHPSITPASAIEMIETSAEIRDFVAAMKAPYCGNHPVYETNRWFGEIAPHLKSFAIVPLSGKKSFGLLLLASEETQRFYPNMGTFYLTRIGELISAAIEVHIA